MKEDKNDTYGTYARGWDGEGDYGDGDKVYVSDANVYYGSQTVIQNKCITFQLLFLAGSELTDVLLRKSAFFWIQSK